MALQDNGSCILAIPQAVLSNYVIMAFERALNEQRRMSEESRSVGVVDGKAALQLQELERVPWQYFAICAS